jgi:hypothetical protein
MYSLQFILSFFNHDGTFISFDFFPTNNIVHILEYIWHYHSFTGNRFSLGRPLVMVSHQAMAMNFRKPIIVRSSSV